MITNTGKNIIGKYMIGQAPAYASYIAIGCGAKPTNLPPDLNNAQKENLDFEMFRVPISSRGFIKDVNSEKIVLTAELPTEERYEISEVGLYSAGSNPSAGAYDSKTVLAFTQGENWQYHTESSATVIPTISAPLDEPNNNNNISTSDIVFQTNANNPIFFNPSRADRYERCRFLNNTILIRGDMSDLTIDESTGSSANHFVIEPGSDHIHLTGVDVDFTRNSPIDELRFALSVVNKYGNSNNFPDRVRVLIDFSSTDQDNTGEFARFEMDLEAEEYGLLNNRYCVVKTQLQDLYQTQGFTWNAVTVIKIYACAIVADLPSEDYYIALDALRLENIAKLNPLYGMTGYSVVHNDDAVTIVKDPNSNNYIEFRFVMDVQ